MVVGEFSTDVDLIVIGSGPGGYVAAIRAAQLGKNVIVVDKNELGGVCLNRGCIPSKALISAAHEYDSMKSASTIGIQAEGVTIDFGKVQQWKQGIVDKLVGGIGTLFKGNKIQFLQGEVMFVSEHEVRVIGEYESARYRFNDCIIASGSRPIELKAFPFGKRVLSSTEALRLPTVPESMIVIGGGYIGIELGEAYAKFGAKVTVIEGTESILPGFEQDMTKWVSRSLKKSGVEIVTEAMAKGVEQTDKDVTVTYEVKGEQKQATAEYVLVTVGRRANTDQLGLEVLNLKMEEKGLISVDEQCRTSSPHIYAIGDIVKGPALAHKASYEGKVAAEAIAGEASIVDYRIIPEVVFCEPELASVGMNERSAKEQGLDYVVGKFPYAANGRALSLQAAEGFVKLIADKESGRLLGAQVLGEQASNVIAELGLAIEMGAMLDDIALTIHAHPTLGEMVMEAAEGALGRAIHQLNK